MAAKNKFLIGALTIGATLFLLVFAFLSRQTVPASAREENLYSYLYPFPYPVLVCDEPIPVGEVWEETTALLNDVYREYQSTRDYLASAVKETQSALSELYKQGNNVCDFSLCLPQVADQGGDIKLDIAYLFGSKTIAGIHLPVCKAKKCLGSPCPDLSQSLDKLTGLKSAVEGSRKIIHSLFNDASAPVTEDIRKKDGSEPKNKQTLIRLPDVVGRKLQLAREWLHASTETGKRSCSLTESERKKAAAGELGDRYPVRCVDALNQGVYWPKMWSENCQTECGDKGKMEDCVFCLGNPAKKGTSVLAQINYKIYNTCNSFCKDGLEENCLNCLCAAEDGSRLSKDQCIAWICGGSYYNYVCCHETPLETE